MGDGVCSWFGRPPTTTRVVGTAQRAKKILPVGNAQQQMFGGYIDGDGGVRARIKVTKLAKNIFNNQQRLEAAMEGSGGVAWMGGNDNLARQRWRQGGQ